MMESINIQIARALGWTVAHEPKSKFHGESIYVVRHNDERLNSFREEFAAWDWIIKTIGNFEGKNDSELFCEERGWEWEKYVYGFAIYKLLEEPHPVIRRQEIGKGDTFAEAILKAQEGAKP